MDRDQLFASLVKQLAPIDSIKRKAPRPEKRHKRRSSEHLSYTHLHLIGLSIHYNSRQIDPKMTKTYVWSRFDQAKDGLVSFKVT